MTLTTEPTLHRAELLLRTNRRALFVMLATTLLVGATLIAHAIRPGTLLADWPSKAPWLFPTMMIAAFVILNAPLGRRRADDPQVRALLEDEFRKTNLSRAQRLALIVVLVGQIPLAIALSGLSATAAVMVMAVANITVGMAALISSFLFFDRG